MFRHMYSCGKGTKDVHGAKTQIRDTGSFEGGRGKEKREHRALQPYW